MKVPFGKYKGYPVEALGDDPKYVRWLTTNVWFRFAVEVSRQPWFNRIASPDRQQAKSGREGD